MQHVTAFSPPQTVPTAPAVARKPNLWILSSWRDLILYVCTPLLIIPMFIAAQARWSAMDIYLFVAAFGAMGHHLPGMIRAYGDRALFERFRWRFILAPIFLVVVCIMFSLWELKGIVLVAFVWGIWHGMMQTYGFCRIYDAKVGSFSPWTRRIDFATCGVWFAAAVLLSSPRMTDLLNTYYGAGGTFIPLGLLRAAQQAMVAAVLAISAAFLANFIWMWIAGKRSNPVKLVLLLTGISFWWYCNNIVANILVGVALFEVFHDVQYLSLVWIYNRKRVETDSSIGGFMRFVFRRSGSLIGLYVGLIFAYGAFGYFKYDGIDNLKRVLTGVVTASALLHFYYDGFIWKVREKSTRKSLGIEGGTADISGGGFLPSWAMHGLKWVAVFVIPVGALWLAGTRVRWGELDRLAMIVADLPGGDRAHTNYGRALQDAGKLDEAEREFALALRHNPSSPFAHADLAAVLSLQGKLEEAQQQFEEALRIRPYEAEFHAGYAFVLERFNRLEQAEAEYQVPIQREPNSAHARFAYGAFLERQGRLDEAIVHYRHSAQSDPNFLDAHFDLANALFSKGELAEAKVHYLEASHLDGKLAQPHNYVGKILLHEGNVAGAIAQFEEALRLHPDFPEAEENLRMARAQVP
ncbi:MAG: tetratricopeptide repeat protein [Spartobacteria bacterium]